MNQQTHAAHGTAVNASAAHQAAQHPHARRRPAALAGAAALGALALTFASAAGASAHVTASTTTAEAGAYAVVSLSVPHGCDASPTTRVAIQIPDGINAVTPTRNSFYTVDKVMEQLDTPITDSHGNEVTERVAEVVYSATTPLPSDQRDVFELSLKLPDDAAGETLFFPAVQTCEEGESAWVQQPAAGQDPHDLDLPAPAIEVIAASDSGHGHGHGADGHGGDHDGADHDGTDHDGTDEAASGAGGASPLVITSLAVGALGFVTAVAAFIRGRK